MKLNNWTKLLLLFLCGGISVIGFMVRLPAVFRHFDKELHAIFYFAAAAFLNILFTNRNIIKHVAIFIALYLFSVGIEYAQEYSNKFFHKRIHGRYDIEDIQANLKGLVVFSVCWISIVIILYAYDKVKLRGVENSRQGS